MKIGIMQPYFLPYIGYFQLINAVDKFVFYDDVNFVKNGWINRNRILIQGNPAYFTVPLKAASSFKPINEIEIANKRDKLLKTIQMAYHKAPYFEQVFPLIENCLNFNTDLISELAINSVRTISSHLKLNTKFEISGTSYSESKPFDKTQRILSICKRNKASVYINAHGGKELYAKEDFLENGLDLFFIQPKDNAYKQFDNEFIPMLSILDVMMFNPPEEIQRMLDNYELI